MSWSMLLKVHASSLTRLHAPRSFYTYYFKLFLAEDMTFTIGSCSSSRFVILLLNMLTWENETVDLSIFINEGLLGLLQCILRSGYFLYPVRTHAVQPHVNVTC